MKIAYVYDCVYPWELGGVQKRVWELARRLAGEHDVHWFGLHYWDGPRVMNRDGVTLHGVAPVQNLYVDGRRSIREALSFGTRLVSPLARAKFDVIDCQAFPYFPVFPGKLNGVLNGSKLIVTWHEVWNDYWYEYLGRKGVFGKLIERIAAHLPDAHIAVSNRTREDVLALGGTDPTLVPNGIDTTGIEAVPPAGEPVEVLFVGRLIPEKGATLLVRAMAELVQDHSDRTCLIVGEGPAADEVDRAIEAADLSGSITRRDFVASHDEILALMKRADVFALPSRREGFGMTALEALACGTPVVTIDHPQNAVTELVEDGKTGEVCDPTPVALASALEHAGTLDPEACRAAAGRYDWSRIVDRAEIVYEDISAQG